MDQPPASTDPYRHAAIAGMSQRQLNTGAAWASKVPEITLSFWIIKILSTTVGETAADFLAVNIGWGQAVTTAAMAFLLLCAWGYQMRTHRYTPWTYWLTVVLVSIVGTQVTDILTDGLGVSLYVSTAIFSAVLLLVLAIWYRLEGTLSIKSIFTPKRELFYWVAILCTFALGTAAGDLATEALGLGFAWGVVAFGVCIGLSYVAWRLGVSTVLTFWIAYILTRPFGASLGDLLTQDRNYGGFGLGPLWTSAMFMIVIVILVTIEQLAANGRSDSYSSSN